MAEGTNLGNAYIQIIPSAKGISGSISKTLNGEAESAGTSAGNKLSGALGTSLKVGLGVATAAIGAATAAIGKFASSAVSSYAEYEQLVGGVDKLYGEASDKLQEFADQAYMTAGMSANTYMETATSFSASLINSLGGDVDKAADMTDVAMKAISDNVNVFGSDMESVTNAFQGFAKQNYTMLDNLKLGYGGTKEEMQRLIEDANEWGAANGEASDLSIDSFADVVQAIQQIQEKQNIAGTTAAEAMKTIEGSANATKAAWENVVTAIGKGEGIGESFDGLATAIFGEDEGEGLLNQVIPRIQTTMEGIGTFIITAAPMITEKLPELINAVVPILLSSASTLLGTLGQSLLTTLPSLMPTITQLIVDMANMFISALPQIIQVGVEVIISLAEGIISALPEILAKLTEALPTIIQSLTDGLVELIPMLIVGATQLVIGIVAALPEIIAALLEALPQILMSIIEGLGMALPLLWEAISGVFTTLFEKLGELGSNLLTWASEAFTNLINTITEFLSTLPEKMAYYAGYAIGSFIAFFRDLPENLAEIWETIKTKVAEFGENFKTKATEIGTNFFNSLVDGIKNLPTKIATLATDLVDEVKKLPDKFLEIGSNIVEGLWNGISGAWEWLKEKVSNLASNLLQGAKDALGIASPSKAFRDQVGKWIPAGIAVGITGNMSSLNKAMADMSDEMLNSSLTEIPGMSFGRYNYNSEMMATSGGYNQTVNIYSPRELTPSEVARQTKNATRNMILALRGV